MLGSELEEDRILTIFVYILTFSRYLYLMVDNLI